MRYSKAVIVCLIAFLWPVFSAYSSEQKSGVTRRLVFPARFSCGTLYSYKENRGHQWLPIASDAKRFGHLVGEARGIIDAPSDPDLYLIASYDLVAHPDALNKLSPDALQCISFGRIGSITPLDPIFGPLSRLTGLRRLEFDCADLPDKVVEKLRTLVNLEALDLTVCSIQGCCFQKLGSLTKLKELNLADNELKPQSFACISTLPSLVYLDLSHCGVNDADVITLSKLRDLKHLALGRSLVTGRGLAQMKNFKSLRELALNQTKLSVDELCCLKGCRLAVLYLPNGNYSTWDMERLKKAMPLTQFSREAIGGSVDPNTFFAPLH